MQRVYIISVKFCDHNRRIYDNRLRYYRTTQARGLNHFIEVPYFDKTRFAVVWQVDVPEWRVPFGIYIGNLPDYDAAKELPEPPAAEPETERDEPEAPDIEMYPLRGWQDA